MENKRDLEKGLWKQSLIIKKPSKVRCGESFKGLGKV